MHTSCQQPGDPDPEQLPAWAVRDGS